MPKKILLLALALVFVAGAAAQAAEMGGSYYFIKKGMFEVSLQGTYVNESKLKQTDNGGGTFLAPRQDVKIKQDKQVGAIVAYGLHDRINVWVELGAAFDGRLSGSSRIPGTSTYGDTEATLENVFAWAVGIKGKLYEHKPNKGFGIAAALRYYRYDDRKADNWTVTDTGSSFAKLQTDAQFSYWQFEGSVSAYWKFKRFVPYFGAKYTYAEGDLSGTWSQSGTGSGGLGQNYEPEEQLGLFGGFDYHFRKHWRINVQANFYSDTALMVSGSYVF
ncbi:MAG: hypothetical protein K9K65_18450 [Desulfarculaceae bacterium]|nr:hypothetical protein [Desulfarculaceae bacterium]MCF8048032.1 hypothetical protein [Desulfarculaceae bacterium]MCF8066572.1 hypothetical protein [Desulfarculaceae bacterium]MCF8099826.1 hypothetical protein [Desulfarculaceae bacterium]MCF8123643.1 hypothetical protein [Desulfarculaceae bacterium]